MAGGVASGWGGAWPARPAPAFPEAARVLGAAPRLVKPPPPHHTPGMATREEILVLGLTAGVTGCLVGGMMLGIGLGLTVQGQHLGWLLILPSAPVAGGLGLLLAKRLVGRKA